MLALLDLDPNIVKPGWIPLLITIGLAAVMVLLFFSLRRQFRRIDVSQSQPGSWDAFAQAAQPWGTLSPDVQAIFANPASCDGLDRTSSCPTRAGTARGSLLAPSTLTMAGLSNGFACASWLS